MRELISYLINFLGKEHVTDNMNVPLLVITLTILLIAFALCIIISRKNKLYIRQKKDKKDNAYT